ncbi:phthioceranic/hydroxyphthioceranic acid synthase [Centropristis striata]|uniref:phthioceranic/hydroxyphthioceranic acid synthase n=1 Tax=Centropristis striata TaxID=184440 RepID=UPI0027E1A74F|nr:phthioceranic/hydroxyphthioceranic acid synthase [Centropristis striata]
MEDADDDIAVIGIGCNFPGGEGLDNFWGILLEGKNCAVDIPAERFDTTLWYDADDGKPGKTQTTKAALIEGFNEFDHKFFGITEAEADFMDPQQKLLLQCTYRALEDAGISMESISGSRAGVYIGLMNRDYEILQSNSPTKITHYNGTGTAMSVAANRISFTFNLTGPSLAIDSACSSSLVALHLACQAIKQGDCEMALCGGVSCIIEPRVFVALSKAKMISPEGTSKPFSNRADGYGRGEGCGVVLLKPLKNAIKDGNKVWGIVSKTAVNQDGHSVTPITKPSMIQQQELLQRIYSESDLADVQYIEAHGTGTPVGDPTEAESISNVIAKAKPPGSETLRIGSVKSNIGHTESAAGVAGLIKVLLMIKNATTVPSVFYSEDSANVDVKALSLSIPIKAERWETNGSLGRVAGVNSFGFGGTNAHVIVREYRQTIVPNQNLKTCPKLFVLSAASEKSLILNITDTHQRLCSKQAVDLQALSYTSACRRSHSRHKYRKTFPTSSLSDLKHQLASALHTKVESTSSDIQLVFVFCGNGVAYRGMCKQLLREFPVFRDKVQEIENLFQSHTSISISQWLAGEYDHDDFGRPHVVQPLLFAVQVGIATLLKHWGVKPGALLGHSVGEVAAAHCSGLLSLEDAVKVLYHRSTLQSKVTGGKMLVVGNVAVEKVLKVLPEFSGKICVAAFNSSQSCTLSGDADAIDILHQRLKIEVTEKNVFLHELDVPAAYHSHLMDPILDGIEKSIGPLNANNQECKLFSTVTGDSYLDGDFTTGRYWARNIREPVLFEQTLRAVTKDKQSKTNMVFVEIGPRRALQRNILEILGNNATVLSSVQPGKDFDTILSTVAKLFELGISVDWHQLYRGYETLPTALPVYQFVSTKKELSFEAAGKGVESSAFPPHMLICKIKQDKKEYMCDVSLETAPYLWDHKNNGVPIVPGAFYVELAYASVMEGLRPKKPVSLLQLSVRFESLLTLRAKCHQLKVTLEHAKNETSFKIQSSVATHASGTYKCADGQLEEPAICINTISQRCKLVMKRIQIYSILSQAGFEYGAVFKQLDDVHFGDEFKEAVTTILVPGELQKHLHEYCIHPVILDYFLQMTAVVAIGQLTAKPGFPSAISSVTISGPLQKEMVMYLRAIQETPEFLEVCGCFSTTEGHVLVELKGVRISFLGNSSSVLQSWFFHNEICAIPDKRDLQNSKIKAIVFEDKLGIAKGLKPYIHPGSTFVESRDRWLADEVRNFVFGSLNTKVDLENILYIWGVEDLSHLSSEKMLDCLVTCCELFRQIVLALKESKRSCTVRIITYRSTEMIVDHVSPGFVLSGMTRACAAEMAGLSFQLIDLASVTSEDIQTLARVLNTCKQQEVMISKGQASTTRIARTPMRDGALCEGDMHSGYVSDFLLQTTDPYRLAHLSAIPYYTNANPVQEKSVEIQLSNLCVHSSDYFPVTTSHLNFGRTMYWNKHTSQNHKLLALDFSGTVTAVGKNVHNLRVGDHVASCYPIPATAKIIIPEAVCYSSNRLPFLKETPCVSYFVLAWEILQRMLSNVKHQHRKLVIICANSTSSLMKVLALTANRSGWNVSSLPHFREESLHYDQSNAVVFLPPFDHSWQGMHNNSDHDRHVIFVCSSHMSSLPANMFALRTEHMHVHQLDLAHVLQKANLQVQNNNISNWLMSLGFESESLPLKRKTFQLSSTKEPQTDADAESYFTTRTVHQVVLNHRESDCLVSDIPIVTRHGQLFKQSCVYIVTGGLSGLGLETVKFIAHNGGGCIATLSRSTLTDKMQFEMQLLQKRYAVTVLNLQCDVSVSMQVVYAISKIEQRFPSRPIKGVFHSAAVLHDALIENLDESLFRKVLQPKVSGALNLHYATLHKKLDFFVCYSSISSFIGNASQCNYSAANSFLDTFCHYRRNLGLAGQSINWGPLNLGLLLNKNHFQKFLEAKGMMTMDVCDVQEALGQCLVMNRPQQVICKFNFRNLHIHVLSQNASLRERLSALVEMELKDKLCNEPMVQHFPCTHDSVRMIVSDISNVSIDELDDDSALCALGIDSMLAMTLQNKIFQETGVNVPLVRILDPNSTPATLAAIVKNNG